MTKLVPILLAVALPFVASAQPKPGAQPASPAANKGQAEIPPWMAVTPMGFWLKAAQGGQNAHQAGQKIFAARAKGVQAARDELAAAKALALAQQRHADAQLAAAQAAEELMDAHAHAERSLDLFSPFFWMGMKK
jgi:hypothetical protein